MNIPLLRVLQSQPDSFLWPESLARSLRIEPEVLLRDLGQLEAWGFVFERHPHRGIRLVEAAQRLCVDQIEWQLDTRIIGRRIAVWRRTTSTNDLAARAAGSRSNEGLVILAEEQTAGRGRLHRRWHAPPYSAILMSVLLFPPARVRDPALVTSLAAVAVAEVISESFGLPARIKWPNDVLVDGEKVCGILVEDLVCVRTRRSTRGANAAGATRPRRATIVGIGVNVNMSPTALPRSLRAPATSLQKLCGRKVDRSELVRLLIQRLDLLYGMALDGNGAAIGIRWRSHADLIGRWVTIQSSSGQAAGRLEDLSPMGQCSVRLASGQLLQLAAHELIQVAGTE